MVILMLMPQWWSQWWPSDGPVMAQIFLMIPVMAQWRPGDGPDFWFAKLLTSGAPAKQSGIGIYPLAKLLHNSCTIYNIEPFAFTDFQWFADLRCKKLLTRLQDLLQICTIFALISCICTLYFTSIFVLHRKQILDYPQVLKFCTNLHTRQRLPVEMCNWSQTWTFCNDFDQHGQDGDEIWEDLLQHRHHLMILIVIIVTANSGFTTCWF